MNTNEAIHKIVYIYGFHKPSRVITKATGIAVARTLLPDSDDVAYTIQLVGTKGNLYYKKVREDKMATIQNIIRDSLGGYLMATFDDDVEEYKRKLAKFFENENEKKEAHCQSLMNQIEVCRQTIQNNNELIEFLT